MLVAVITIFARLCKGAIKTKNVGNGKSVYVENQTSIASKSREHLQRPSPKPELKRQADVRQVSEGPESFKGVRNKIAGYQNSGKSTAKRSNFAPLPCSYHRIGVNTGRRGGLISRGIKPAPNHPIAG